MSDKTDRTDYLKKNLLIALRKTLGNVTEACEMVKCDRDTYYEYRKKDPKFKSAVTDIKEIAIDFVEGKLFQKINGVFTIAPDGVTIYQKEPDTASIIFYLKTQAKSRGYIERQEISFQQEQPFWDDNLLEPIPETKVIDVTPEE